MALCGLFVLACPAPRLAWSRTSAKTGLFALRARRESKTQRKGEGMILLLEKAGNRVCTGVYAATGGVTFSQPIQLRPEVRQEVENAAAVLLATPECKGVDIVGGYRVSRL